MPRLAPVAAGAVGLLMAGLIAPVTVTVAQAGPSVQPRNGAPPTTTYAVIRLIGVGSLPEGVAIDESDDTVYVTNNLGINNVSVINGRTGIRTDDTISLVGIPFGVAVDQGDDTVYVVNNVYHNVSVINGRTRAQALTIPVGNGPRGVAVDQGDDTVYVTSFGAGGTVSVIDGRTRSVARTIPVGPFPVGVAVNQVDDTVYVTSFRSDGTVSVINGRNTDDRRTVNVGDWPVGVAVDQTDDTVYVTNSSSNTVSVINGRNTDDSKVVNVGVGPEGVAVNQVDDTVYVTNSSSNTVSVINGRTGALTGDTIAVGTRPTDVAVDDSGLVYVVNPDRNSVSVIGRASPSLGASNGSAGDAVTINVNVPQVDYDVDDSTVASVSFDGGTPITPTPLGGDAWRVIAPAGTPGSTVQVTVTFRGGLTASAGTFTYAIPPPPPVFPPSAPVNVTAVAGDAQATVTWTAPASSGSFPVTTYEVRSTPAGGTCLVATLTCTVTGLTNDTAYTFEARALNGAGWGPWSTPSNAVTPRDPTPPPPPPPAVTISITGSRGTGAERQVVFVTGTSTGLGGKQVRSHVRLHGQADYRPGRLVNVSAEGRFDWQRTTGKKTYVYFTGGGVQSNRVIIPAARR